MQRRSAANLAACALLAFTVAVCGGDNGVTAGGDIESVVLSRTTLALGVGSSFKLIAHGTRGNGSTVPDPAGTTWISSDTTIAAVDQNGNVTGKKLGGPVTVTASVGGHDAAGAVTITPASVSIHPANSSSPMGSIVQLDVGAAIQFVAQPLDAQGGALVTGPITWGAVPSGVVTVSQSGLVTAIHPGLASITAAVAGREDIAQVGVFGPYEGVWSGNLLNATGNPVAITVRYGTVVQIDITRLIVGCTTLRFSVPAITSISGNMFSSVPALGGAISGTFMPDGTLAVTHTLLSFSSGPATVICDDGRVLTGFPVLGSSAFTATRPTG